MKKIALTLLTILLLAVIGLVIYLPTSNTYQTDGEATLSGLSAEVRVVRDENGMPYIYADNLQDAFRAQGFVIAQDRLFQMQLTRLFAEGRISELAGEQAIGLDTRMRTFGFYKNAKKHVALLDEETMQMLRSFTEGVNAYIDTADDIPVEFALAGIEAEHFSPETCVAILYYMGWGAASNYETEFMSQLLIDTFGYEKFLEIYPIAANPDYPSTLGKSPANLPDTATMAKQIAQIAGASDLLYALKEFSPAPLTVGSNNWVNNGQKSASGKPILANDPHLDSRILPGVLYSCGIFTPEMRTVGATVPGLPGIIIGRNQYIASGLTNAYLDAQDLYIEQVNPNNPKEYLEGEQSIPFEIVKEVLKIKDGESPTGYRTEEIEIWHTRRGPVISKVLSTMNSDRVVSLRWAAYETMGTKLGLTHLMEAHSVKEAITILSEVTASYHNVTLADVEGNIGWVTLGRLPIRPKGQGMVPKLVTDTVDNWLGFIPVDSMPRQYNPAAGWIGNANNNRTAPDYPYYVSNHYGANYRYKRMLELMNSQDQFTTQNHWDFQLDEENVLARKLAPIFAQALAKNEDTKAIADHLANWDAVEDLESIEATIYQYTYKYFVQHTFEDEMGDALGKAYFGNAYMWKERLEQMVDSAASPWFDRVETLGQTESLEDIIVMAGQSALKVLREKYGEDMQQWAWGKVHFIEYVSPIRRSGAGKELLGGSSWPMAGSSETLRRARHSFDDPSQVVFAAALRMVVDLADDEKVQAVLSGGETARTFSDHQSDQLDEFTYGKPLYWWFSEEQIKAHQQHLLRLKP